VLVNGNPLLDLEALRSIDMVMKEGRVVYGRSYAPATIASQVPQAR
jgi:imidazolonepropionase-like amidohydrolase